MTPSPLPVIRLLPKTKPQAIRRGYPWVYANEVVTDRRTRAMTPGTIAVLEDAERSPLALVAVFIAWAPFKVADNYAMNSGADE